MKKNGILYMVISALLCAMGILIPIVMPKIEIGPMSFTLASHVPIFIAMFISLPVAIAVSLVTTVGFFFAGFPMVVVLRALSQIVFVLVGTLMLKKKGTLIASWKTGVPFGLFLAVIHAAFEVIVVAGFYFGGSLGEQFYQNGFIMSVLLLVGVGTIAHSMVDYAISALIWKPCQHVIRIPVYAKVS